MVGGVLEGLLFNEFGNERFIKLISLAEESELISGEEVKLIDDARQFRNRIHASKHNEGITDRKVVLDLSTTYGRMIKRRW